MPDPTDTDRPDPAEMTIPELVAELRGHVAALDQVYDLAPRTRLVLTVAAEMLAAQHQVIVLQVGAMDAVDQALDQAQTYVASVLDSVVHRNVQLLAENAALEARNHLLYPTPPARCHRPFCVLPPGHDGDHVDLVSPSGQMPGSAAAGGAG